MGYGDAHQLMSMQGVGIAMQWMHVRAGFPGHDIPEINPSCHHQPRITVTGGHVLVTEYQAITRIWIQDHIGLMIQQ